MASGYCIGQRRYKTFSSLQKVLFDSAVPDNTLSTLYVYVFLYALLKESMRCRDYHNCTDMETEAQRG